MLLTTLFTKNNHNARKANFWKEQYNQDRMNLEDE